MTHRTYPAGRKRLPKGTEVVEWTARLPVDTYLYLVELARNSGQELPIALDTILKRYRELFRVQQ
jgi:hypothetical protein